MAYYCLPRFQGVPDPMRGQIWQMLADVDDDSEILSNYTVLAGKVSPEVAISLYLLVISLAR